MLTSGYFSLRAIIRFNLFLVLAIGIYGFFTDEPYWIVNGRGPDLYEYFFWLGLALNGPSGFAADYPGWLFTSGGSDRQLKYVIQYVLWLLFPWLQSKAYDLVVSACISHRRREVALRAAIFFITLVGGVAAYKAWQYGHRPREINFIDQYFWFVRIGGTALSGPVILAYGGVVRSARTL